MPKKSRTYRQKQKQLQTQKVVVNVGEVKKRKRAKKRRPKQPSQEATEYAEAISRIVPRIQYTFPSHSNFNYDAYRTPDLVPQARQMPVEVPTAVAIPLVADKTFNEKQNVLQEAQRDVDTGFKKKSGFRDIEFVEGPAPSHDLKIAKPEPSSPYRELPINHPDRIPSLTQGLIQFQENEQKPLVKQSKRVNKPSNKNVLDYLNAKGLGDTPSNREMAVQDILRAKQASGAAKVRQTIQKELRVANKKLVESGRASVPRQRPTILADELTATVPILEDKKVHTLADIREKQENIAKLEKRLKSTKRGPRLIIEKELEEEEFVKSK